MMTNQRAVDRMQADACDTATHAPEFKPALGNSLAPAPTAAGAPLSHGRGLAAGNPAMRRQSAAVLVVDMVESVRLIQDHEAAIVQRWSHTVRQVREGVLPRHRGEMVKSLGDGLLARFGSAREAVVAAQEIHALLDAANLSQAPDARVKVRAGVHVTDFWADGTDIYGAGINLTARLATLAGPGETVASAAVRDVLTQGLDAVFEDIGECYLKHIHEPVRAYRVGPPAPHLPSVSQQAEAAAMQPTIAVIPFSCRGGEAQHFAIGELIADGVNALLSGSQTLNVVSRLSTTVFRDRGTDIVEIQKRLGANYVLSGSYVALGNRLLINAELARAGDARVVWADRLSGNVQDLLEVRSELIDGIAHSVNAQVFEIEMKRTGAQPLPTLESYSLLLGGINRMHSASRSEFDRTGQLLEFLIERHQRIAAPRTWLANWYILRATRGISADRVRDARIALDMTRRALDADPADSLAMAVEGFVHCHLLKDLDAGQQRCEQALSVNPNQALAWLYKGAIHAFRGEGAAAVNATRRALALSPLDPQRYYFESLAATAATTARDYPQAQQLAESSLRLNRMHSSTWRTLILSLVRQGKLEAATSAMLQLRRLEPDLTVQGYLARMPNGHLSTGRDCAEALAIAGLPRG